MIELLKKIALTGVGLAAMSGEKIEEWSKKIAEELKLSEAEGRKFLDDIRKQSAEAKENLEKQINEQVKRYMERIGVATRDEKEKLEKRIEELEKMLREEREKKG